VLPTWKYKLGLLPFLSFFPAYTFISSFLHRPLTLPEFLLLERVHAYGLSPRRGPRALKRAPDPDLLIGRILKLRGHAISLSAGGGCGNPCRRSARRTDLRALLRVIVRRTLRSE